MLIPPLFALVCGAPLAWQEPAPEQEPAPQEQTEPLTQEEAMEAVMAAIDVVRDSFMRADRTWTEVRSTADDLLDSSDEEQLGNLLDQVDLGLSQAEELVEQMETLLSLLPESDSQDQQQQQQQQQSGDQQQQQDPSQQREGDETMRDADGNPLDGNELMENQSTNEPAPNDAQSARQPMFLAPGSGGGSWGHLPPRLQETLQNSNAEDLPLRYRGLLEDYYRKQQGDSER